MEDFSTYPNTNGSYPDVTARNATSPGVTDGTPLVADVYNDWWGFAQAALNLDGQTPSGEVEADGASQLLDTLVNMLSPVGTILSVVTQNDFVTEGLRLLPLDYQLIEIALYPGLVARTYVGDAQNTAATGFYKTDAGGIRDTAGLYFRIPKGDGMFLRNYDPVKIKDRVFGDRVNGKLGQQAGLAVLNDHSHRLKFTTADFSYVNEVDVDALPNGSDEIVSTEDDSTGYSFITDGTQTYVEATETDLYDNAPDNMNVRMGIRY